MVLIKLENLTKVYQGGQKEAVHELNLGNMTVQLLKNHGYQVKDRTSLGSTAVLRLAIETDEIDLYWEYTGTTLMTTMGSKEVVVDPEETYNRVENVIKRMVLYGLITQPPITPTVF